MKLLGFKLDGKRYLFVIFGVIMLAALAGFLFWSWPSEAAEFTTAKVERGNVRNVVSATGALQAVTTVLVGSQVSGVISAIHVDFNAPVKKGQVIAQIDPATFQAQVAQANANLEAARAGLLDAKAKLLAAQSTVQSQQAGVSSARSNATALKAQRDDSLNLLRQQETLVASGIITQRDLQTAQTAYRADDARYNQAVAQLNQARTDEQSAAKAGIAQAEAQVEQSQAQVRQNQASLRMAEVNLGYTTIASPIDGVVVSRDVDVGQTVAASLSAPTLFTIANDLTQMQVIANVDQADIGNINQSNSANFTVDTFPGENFSGTIKQIRLLPENVQNVVTYNVVIDVANPDLKLKPGMTANLILTIAEHNDILKIPNAALRFRPQGSQDQSLAQNSNRPSPAASPTATDGANITSGGQQADPSNRITPAISPLIEGQTRIVWILGPDGKPQPRRIKIGITDGISTEVVEGDLKISEPIIIGQTLSEANRSQTNQTQPPPGFGGGRGGGGGGSRRP